MSNENRTIFEREEYTRTVDRTVEDYESYYQSLYGRSQNTNRRMNNAERRIHQTEERLRRQAEEFNERLSRQDQRVANLSRTLAENTARYQRQYAKMGANIHRLAEEQKRVNEETNKRLRAQQEKYRQDQARINSEMDGIRGSMHDINKRIDNNQRANIRRHNELKAEQSRMRSEFVSMINQNAKDSIARDEQLERQMFEIRNELVNDLNLTRQNLQAQIDNVQKTISDYIEQNVAQENRRMRTAEIWELAVENALSFLGGYNHEVLAPHKVENLRIRFQNTKQFKSSDNIQVFISQMVDIYRAANELNLDLLEAESEWNDLFTVVETKLADVISKNNSLNGIFFSVPYSTKPVEGRIDYWTDGAFNELKNSLRPINEKLHHQRELIGNGKNATITVQELKLLSNELDRIDHQYDTLEDVAKRRIISSAHRRQCYNNIAKCLMKDHGFKQVTESDCGFRDGEEKSDFMAVFSATNGDKIAVVIKDKGDNTGNYEVETFVHDKENDPKIHEMYANVINQALNTPGARVKPNQCFGSGYSSAEYQADDEAILRDIKEVTRKKGEN